MTRRKRQNRISRLQTGPVYRIGVSALLVGLIATLLLSHSVTLAAKEAPAAPLNSLDCAVDYTVTSDWSTGFNADVTITNNDGLAIDGWTLTWTFPGNQVISTLWNGVHSQNGRAVSVANASWNAAIPANGGSITFGFGASYSGANGAPTDFRLNGVACNGAASTITPTALPPTSTPTATPTALPPTSTPTPGAGCIAPPWSPTTVYWGGDEASHNGHEWRARWWTLGEEPGSTGPWGVWQDLGACAAVPPTPTTAPPTTTPTSTPGGPTPTATPTSTPGSPGQRDIVAYFVQWGVYQRNYHVKNIATSGSAEKITVINYAFGHIVDGECVMVTQPEVMDAYADYQKTYSAADSVDGVADAWNQPLRGNFNQLQKLKALYPHVKVLISLGGWTWSEGFSDAALTPQSRQLAAQSCIDIYIKGNLPYADNAGGPGVAAGVFDGIDIDWEYPAAPGHPHNVYRPEDTQNFTALLAEFRRQLDEIDPDLLLTIAAPVGVDKYEKIEINQIHPHLDWINLMAYDMHGAWESVTNFHTPLFTSPADPSPYPANTYATDTAVQAYLAGGVPADKLLIGVPFYGRGWTGVANANNGLYQPAAGPAPGTYEAGVEDYKVLKNLGYPAFRDAEVGAFWVFDGNIFWSYDDPIAIGAKMDYIQAHDLRGAMAWSLDGDDADGALMTAINDGLQ